MDLSLKRDGLSPLPRVRVEAGDYRLEFRDTPAIEGALVITDFWARSIGAHPCRIFSHFNDVTTLGEDGKPLEEIPLQIMPGSSLRFYLPDSDKPVRPHAGYYTLIRQRTRVNRLVIKELLDKNGPLGLPESRWMWLWFANDWDSWRITLMQEGNLFNMPKPTTITRTPLIAHQDDTPAASA